MDLLTRTGGYTLLIAADAQQVAAAQRLRYQVFAGELGATLHTTVPGHDVDEFDDACDHLIVRDDKSGEIVGTYRMLLPGRAPRRYAETEFDLSALDPLRDLLVETGRSCVAPEHRSGAVINLMWAGIARYLHLHNKRWLGGCASISLEDGGKTAAAVWERARTKHLSPPRMRVRPHHPLQIQPAEASSTSALPPLLRGYLRLGAWVCGPPAYDPDFDVADLYVLLSTDRIDPRYRRHFLGEEQ
ncbi:MAG TPA: GNAT family N-acyltransferase [Asanoa sp.]|nr:GNAT family N-acyltransferase [Asanoa sp.]